MDFWHGDFQVDDFIVLQVHINVFKLAQQRGFVGEMGIDCVKSGVFAGKLYTAEKPCKMPPECEIYPSEKQPELASMDGFFVHDGFHDV